MYYLKIYIFILFLKYMSQKKKEKNKFQRVIIHEAQVLKGWVFSTQNDNIITKIFKFFKKLNFK